MANTRVRFKRDKSTPHSNYKPHLYYHNGLWWWVDAINCDTYDDERARRHADRANFKAQCDKGVVS